MDFDALFAEMTAPLERELVAPLSTMQCQGDVIVRPDPDVRDRMPYYAQPERDGAVIPLIEEGNGHQLRVDASNGGKVLWCQLPGGRRDPLDLGLLVVTPGAVVYVEQVKGLDPHDPLAVGPGAYVIGRQRTVATPPQWWMQIPRVWPRRLGHKTRMIRRGK